MRHADSVSKSHGAARYKLLVDHCSDVMWDMSPDGILLDVSESLSKQTGYEPSFLIGASFAPLIHPDDVAACSEFLKKVLAKKTVLHSPEYRFRHANGTWHWYVAACTPVLGQEGDSISMVGVSRDITDRKQTEEKLKESEKQFRAIFDTASIGMVQTDPQTGRFLNVNRKMSEITGYSSDEMLRMCVPDITHPEDRQLDWNLFQRVLRGEIPEYRLEKRYIRKDGRIVWVNGNMTIIKNEDGQPVRAVATIEEISSRKGVEEALRESEEKFRKVFQTNRDPITVTRISDGTYRMVNEGFTEVTGYSESEVIGSTSFDINIWVNQEDRVRLIEGLKRDGRVENLDAQFRKKDGGILYGITSASVIDLNGIPHALVSVRDITQRKRMEVALRESEEKYRLIFSTTSDVIFSIDSDFKISNLSPTIEKILGYKVEDLINRPFHGCKSRDP